MKRMTVEDFIAMLRKALNSKTLYVLGGWGAPLTAANKTRFINKNAYNKKRHSMIEAATADTFAFDCVNVGKAILMGWNADKSKKNGGAIYGANGVPDTNANGMFKNYCYDRTSDFSHIDVGECLWMDGHYGYYIGNGLAIECTPKWKNGVQITAVGNIGKVDGYPTRTWSQHGKWQLLDYTANKTVPVYRVYNKQDDDPNQRFHHFTPSAKERDELVKLGWLYEGIAWHAPYTGAPVYSIYNPRNGDHLLTTNKGETTKLIGLGLRSEGIKFYSGGSVPVYRLYNDATGEHFYTTNKGEYDELVRQGITGEGAPFFGEGIAFYSKKKGDQKK